MNEIVAENHACATTSVASTTLSPNEKDDGIDNSTILWMFILSGYLSVPVLMLICACLFYSFPWHPFSRKRLRNLSRLSERNYSFSQPRESVDFIMDTEVWRDSNLEYMHNIANCDHLKICAGRDLVDRKIIILVFRNLSLDQDFLEIEIWIWRITMCWLNLIADRLSSWRRPNIHHKLDIFNGE